MSISDMIKQNEKVFKGAIQLKYYFSPSTEQTDHLLVGFSGFNGKEEQGEPARYNYVKQLKGFDCNKLFILDSYADIPVYYLGKNQSLDYEVTVISLITYIANKYNIQMKNIITFGTSKGGTAALYFGMKYRLGHIIAGGMQTKVGDYLFKINNYTRNTVLNMITGDSGEKGRDYLNNFYSKTFDHPHTSSEYNIHGGSGDYHYITYVKPFVENLKRLNIPCNTDVQGYSDHGEIGTYFTTFLYEQLSRITGKVIIMEHSLTKNNETLIASCNISESLKRDKSIRYAFYFLKDHDAQPIKKYPYGTSSTVSYKCLEKGNYRVRVYVKNLNGMVRATTRNITI